MFSKEEENEIYLLARFAIDIKTERIERFERILEKDSNNFSHRICLESDTKELILLKSIVAKLESR